MRRAAVLFVLGLMASEGAALGQSTVGGRVVADDSGEPIPNARVSLLMPSVPEIVALSDAEGRFTFPVPPGRYTIGASKTRYASRELTQVDAALPLEIRLQRGAVIAGRVIDEAGEPVIGARVTAETISGSIVATTDTDDRGEYRLGSLRPDTLILAAMTMGPMIVQALGPNQIIRGPNNYKTFYPGVLTAKEAERIPLQAGQQRDGVDFVIPAAQSANQPFSVIRTGGISMLPHRTAQSVDARLTGAIRGRIVAADGTPLANAFVTLLRDDGTADPRMVRSGSEGQFEFTDLAAAVYRLGASKPGHFQSDRPVEVAENQTLDRVDLTLPHWGTIEGRVLDEIGEPLQGARVEVLQLRYEAGTRRLVPSAISSDTTDDLGSYRLYGLFPGRYIVSAAVGGVLSADLPGYARSYFPGTPIPAQAQFVAIETAQDVGGIDIILSRARTARMAGQLLTAAGEPTTGGSLTLMAAQRSGSATSVPVGARIFPDGRFEFPNVPPGQYVIQAYRGRLNRWTEGEFGALPITVGDTDLLDLVVRTSPGSSVLGRVSFDVYRGTKEPAPSAIEITPVPVDSDLSPHELATASVSANWNFVIQGLNGPRRLQVTAAPAGWTVKEIRANGIDVTDQPLAFGSAGQWLSDVEIVLTDRVNELIGRALDDRARPVPRAAVLVFSADRSRWYPASRFVAQTRAANDGTFALTGLPFGTYYAAAVTQVPIDGADAWQDPDFLESLTTSATHIAIGDGQRTTVTLRVGR